MKITRRIRTYLLAAAICFGSTAGSAYAAYPVYDAGNAALNAQQIAKQAEEIAHAIRQIQNQIRSLENQARMLQDLSFSNYQEALASMRRIRRLLREHCIEIEVPVPNRIGFDSGFDCRELIERFRRTYPAPEEWSGQSDQQIARYPGQWNAQRRDAAAKAMQMQNASVEAMTGTAQRMSELAAASRTAPGQKAAAQVTNELLVALGAQFRSQHTSTLALQRSMAIEQAEAAAWRERNQEMIRRVTRDAHLDRAVRPIRNPFGH